MFFWISFMFHLMRQWECPIWFWCQSVMILFDWSLWRNQTLYKYVAGKGEGGVLVTFPEMCRYSSFILHQNLTNGNFSKPLWNMESDITSVNFCTFFIKIHWSLCALVCSHHTLVIWNGWVHELCAFPNIHMFYHTVSRSHVSITSSLIRKVCKYWEALKLRAMDTSF